MVYTATSTVLFPGFPYGDVAVLVAVALTVLLVRRGASLYGSEPGRGLLHYSGGLLTMFLAFFLLPQADAFWAVVQFLSSSGLFDFGTLLWWQTLIAELLLFVGAARAIISLVVMWRAKRSRAGAVVQGDDDPEDLDDEDREEGGPGM